VRGRKRFGLTQQGRELYIGARRALATLAAVQSQVRRRPGAPKTTLQIGASPSFAGLDLAALISRFIAENPQVRVAVKVGMPLDLFVNLTEEAIELAFVTCPGWLPGE
jgi:LysR family transcriptional regulator of abg operon